VKAWKIEPEMWIQSNDDKFYRVEWIEDLPGDQINFHCHGGKVLVRSASIEVEVL
jgi:hypothetical protein